MQERRIRGHTLRSLRQEAGLHTRELAAEVQVTPGHLRNIEGRNDQPSAVLAHRIARALSVRLGRPISVSDFSDEIDQDAA
jgi:transcriptional regulator with XRE-family HTH domain